MAPGTDSRHHPSVRPVAQTLPPLCYRFRSVRCLSQGSFVVQQMGTALASSRAARIRDVSRAFLDLGATPFSINRLRRRLGSRTTAIRPSGNSTSPSCHAIPSGAASGSLIHASFGSSLTITFHHVPRCWRHRERVDENNGCEWNDEHGVADAISARRDPQPASIARL